MPELGQTLGQVLGFSLNYQSLHFAALIRCNTFFVWAARSGKKTISINKNKYL